MHQYLDDIMYICSNFVDFMLLLLLHTVMSMSQETGIIVSFIGKLFIDIAK